MNEIYPSWYNTLSFLVDMDPKMLNQLLDFSGIRADAYKVVDESFFNFISRINPTLTQTSIKKRLFTDVVSYHNTKLQWIPGQLASALPAFYSTELETFLKDATEKCVSKDKGSQNYYVVLGNIVYVIAYLLRMGIEIDKSYWREKLVRFASEPCANGVLTRHALLALGELKDSTVIDELPDLMQVSDELIVHGFVSMCAELDPNKDKSVDAFIELVRHNDLHGRYGLFEITELNALKRFLEAYNTDECFRREFLDDSSIFKDKDSEIINHIRAVADDELRQLAIEAIIKSFHYSISYTRGKSWFVSGLMSFLNENNPVFITDLIGRIHADEGADRGLYFSQEFFQDLLSVDNVAVYIDAMLLAGMQPYIIMRTFVGIKSKGDESSIAIYEAGRIKAPDMYREYEAMQNQSVVDRDNVHDEHIILEFRKALQPSSGMYMCRVFHDYNLATDKLEVLMNDDDRGRFDTLIREEVLRHDPSAHGLRINSETDGGQSRNYTASGVVSIFGDGLIAAKKRQIDITPYRANIARFIPFAHDEELKTVFELVSVFTSDEIDPVIAIYNDRNTHLWRWQPDAFIKVASNYSLVNAVPILRDFVRESQFTKYDRQEALSVAESLRPDSTFLRGVFAEYLESENDDQKMIAVIANGLLVTRYSDSDAIAWRFKELKARVGESPVRQGSGVVRDVTAFEHELNYGKEFAKPLMDLKQGGFESQYLQLLDTALEVWGRGKTYYAYAEYLWEIVYAYFDNLKEYRDYKPLQLLESKLAGVGGKQAGANWLAARMVRLRRSYLDAIGKPSSYSESIRRYNLARDHDDKRIVTSADLVKHLQDALDTDLRQWIEGEGAYELILAGKVYEAKKQEYEKLIQKTLKAQIENIMRKRGFEIEVDREPETLDDKCVDMLIRYGFIGPVVLEIKLTSNSDLQARNITFSKSYRSMEHYMQAYGATYGIFLLIINKTIKTLPVIKEAFQKIKGVVAISIDCTKFAPVKAKKRISVVTKVTRKKIKKRVKYLKSR